MTCNYVVINYVRLSTGMGSIDVTSLQRTETLCKTLVKSTMVVTQV